MAEVETGADALIKALRDGGIEFVLTNAGTDTAPIIESLAKFETGSNEQRPQFLATPHENVAMAMAHGYYRRSGQPAGAICDHPRLWRSGDTSHPFVIKLDFSVADGCF